MNDTRDVELNAIGVLKRREIEARILAPLVEALGREFGREKVLQIGGETIAGIARDHGRQLVQISLGWGDLPDLRVREATQSHGVEVGRVVCEFHTHAVSTNTLRRFRFREGEKVWVREYTPGHGAALAMSWTDYLKDVLTKLTRWRGEQSNDGRTKPQKVQSVQSESPSTPHESQDRVRSDDRLSPPLAQEVSKTINIGYSSAWAFSPDSRFIVFPDAVKIKIVDIETRLDQTLIEAPGSEVWRGIGFSADGNRLVTRTVPGVSSHNRTMVQVWDIELRKELARIEVEDLMEAVFLPDSKRIMALSQGGSASLLSASSLSPVREFRCKSAEKYDRPRMAISPDGKLLALGDHVFDTEAGSLLGTLRFPGRHAVAEDVVFSADGSHIITGERDGTARYWEVNTWRLVSTYNHGDGGGGTGVALSRDGTVLATNQRSRSAVKLWDVTRGTLLMSLKHTGGVLCPVFSPDGQIIATQWGSRCGSAWEARTGKVLAQYEFPISSDCKIGFSPDGKLMAVTKDQPGQRGSVELIDAARLVASVHG